MTLAISKDTEKAISFGAREFDVSVSEFLDEIVAEKLEDIENRKLIKDYEKRKARGEVEYISNEELAKKYDIEL
jgi:hypothetical protein